MATFSTSQTNQFYVAKSLDTTIDANSALGAINAASNSTDMYLQYKGVDTVLRSDLMPLTQIRAGKATSYADLQRGLQKYTVALDSTVNSGAPVSGQDYMLRTTFFEWGAPSPESQFYKYGVVRATTGMTAEQFYQQMYASLVSNFQREHNPLLNFALTGTYAAATMTTNTGITATANTLGTAGNAITIAINSVTAAADAVVVTGTDIVASLTAGTATIGDLKALIAGDTEASALITITGTNATAVAAETTAVALIGGTTTGISVEEVEQPWRLGVKSSDALMFALTTTPITASGQDVPWGVVTKVASTTSIGNGKVTADREYFYMGERGDIYRNIGFPNNIVTTYLVDPTIEYNYIDLTYYFEGDGENPQKSEKVITIVVPAEGVNNAAKIALANTIITDINSAYGSTLIASLT